MISNVTDMSWMFRGCAATVDISGFNMEKVTVSEKFMDDGKTVNGKSWTELFA